MNERDEGNAAAESPPAGPLRFAYATGSRPLDGYTIKRGVGRGGFGEVYYGTSDGGKQVALKLIRRNLDVELRGVRQCLNLKHPNLVELYDIRQDAADDSWVVMEYVSGDCLEDVLAAHPDGLPPDEALAWFRGLAAGVAYLHDHGIVHRDLKPGNVFREQGIVKIGDYGLSKFISASRRSGQTESVGTVHYMAPEIGHGRYGKEIDVYALGIMLYELFTGRVPFDGESVGEVLMKHLTAEPDLTPLAEPYRTVVARALAKDPAKRIGSVGEMLAALPGDSSQAAAAYVPVAKMAGAQPAGAAVHPEARHGPKPRRRHKCDPVASAYHNARRGVDTFWSSLTPVTKVAAVVLIVYFVTETSVAWVAALPVVIAFLCGYFAWRMVRPAESDEPMPVATIVNGPQARPDGSADDRAAGSPSGTRPTESPQAKRRRGRHRLHRPPLDALPHRTPRERITELTGSLLLSALIASVVGAFLLVVMAGHAGLAGPGPEQYVWLALCGTAGAWAVMVPSKTWEGTLGDSMQRRIVLLFCGLAVACLAWGLGVLLNMPFSPFVELAVPSLQWKLVNGWGWYTVAGEPRLFAYLSYFGLLFAVPRWWRQADPLRRRRVSLWSTALCIGWAWLLSQFWFFPQGWGMMLAACISIAVQFSSPWARAQRRPSHANV